MIDFLGLAAGLALLAALAVALPLVAGRGRAASRAARDAAVFRDQLAEVERDRERGLISDAEAEGTRAEISRRLIAADAQARRSGALGPAPRGLSRLAAGLSLVGVPLLAAGVYLSVGAPGAPDMPYAAREDERAAFAAARGRPTQAQAEARFADEAPPVERPGDQATQDYAALIGRLEQVIEQRPEDLRGLRLLADGYMRLGRYAEAWPLYARMARLQGPRADAALLAAQAEAMVLAAGGYVSPAAETAIDRALALDAELPVARYLRGLALAQGGEIEAAARIWRALERTAPADAPWRPWLAEMLAEAERRLAGTGAPGPAPGGGNALSDMSPEEQEALIEGMVARLESRIAEQGGSPEEWFRLMNAYAVMGRRDEARRVYARSQEALEGSEAGFVREQALLLGLIGPPGQGTE